MTKTREELVGDVGEYLRDYVNGQGTPREQFDSLYAITAFGVFFTTTVFGPDAAVKMLEVLRAGIEEVPLRDEFKSIKGH